MPQEMQHTKKQRRIGCIHVHIETPTVSILIGESILAGQAQVTEVVFWVFHLLKILLKRKNNKYYQRTQHDWE